MELTTREVWETDFLSIENRAVPSNGESRAAVT